MAASDDLQSAYDNYAALLKQVTAAGPKTTYSIDGKSVDWLGYQRFIIESMKTLKQEIISAQGPFEIRSRGVA